MVAAIGSPFYGLISINIMGAGREVANVLHGKRILVVEDEPLIALDIADMVACHGADVVGPAFTLEEAQALVEENQIDGALLDIDLGRTLVWPLAEILHAQGVPFAFVSARCDRPDRPAQLRECVCISKPTSEEAILQAVARFQP